MVRATTSSNLTRRCLPWRAPKGLALVVVVAGLAILTVLGFGLLTIAYGARREAVAAKAETAAMLAAEAGYEKAVYWMSQQQDILSALQQGVPGTTGAVTFPDSSCTYGINLYTFVGTRPVFRIVCDGRSGAFARNVDVLVVQAISGWDMGMCRVPSGATSTIPVNFADGETLDMPISINKLNDRPDKRDIHISGRPRFLKAVAMGESRKTQGGTDKYGGIMRLFEDGIYFDQPTTKVTDEASVQSKVDRFRNSIPRYMERHREKAGMTGWAQVNGLRGDTSIEERTKYDLWYVENWSVLLDVKIIIRTAFRILRDPNAY